MKKQAVDVTFDNIKRIHSERSAKIRLRLSEFDAIKSSGDDLRIFEEMVFCFFTGGCSARMGLNSVERVRNILLTANREELTQALLGAHRYPNARSRYIVESRAFLVDQLKMQIFEKLESFDTNDERRHWLVREKGIKGLGYKEASHFLRNIGYKGYAILDKHVLRCLRQLEIIDDDKPPTNWKRYSFLEQKVRDLAEITKIDFDELDLVLWSMKTGEILK